MMDANLLAWAVATVLNLERKGSQRHRAISFVAFKQHCHVSTLERVLHKLPEGFTLDNLTLSELAAIVNKYQ